MPAPLVLYTAAHGGFAGQPVPLGGGAAVCDWLVEEWSRTQPFVFRLLSPTILGPSAPAAHQIVTYSHGDYARFCRAFEAAATREILRHDPSSTVVLANDVSEGPDFALLARRGFAVYTIYHVDVVDYVATIYGRGMVSPRTLTRLFGRLRGPWLPDIARLIFEKQRASVEHSRGLIVPSARMREVLLECYPGTPPEKVHVIGWGAREAPSDETSIAEEVRRIRQEWDLPEGVRCLLTLSRISPEKGQDLLLESLIEWERRGGLPPRGLCVFICGEAAFMQGRRYLERLRALAARLKQVRVLFPGYVTGVRKQAFFRLADLYVFPSRHESYGLTLMEALAAGVPAVCLDHHGAREVMRPEFGEIVTTGARGEMVRGLADAIGRLLEDSEGRARRSAAAQEYGRSQPFAASAARVAAVISGASRVSGS